MSDPVDELDYSPTQVLSEFLAESRYDALPPAVRERAKLFILDALGCMIAGPRIEPGQKILELATQLDCQGPATLWAIGQHVPALHAAYVNGYLMNVLDFDDTDLGHPGTVVLPPALAVAEQVGASGKELINAVVMGYDVYVRLSTAFRASTERNKDFGGVSSTQLLGVFAATTAATLLLKQDASVLARAYGIAAEHAPVPASLIGLLRDKPLSWMKNNAGWVCLAGALSAELANTGLFASSAIFDPHARLWMRLGSDRYVPDELVDSLGEHYHILGVSLKPYPCCRYLHTTLDALSTILDKEAIAPNAVARVEVRSFTRLGDFLDLAPQTVVDAQYNLPYAIATVLFGRRPGEHWLDLNAQDLIRFARKVSFIPDAEADELYFDFDKRYYPTRVIVELNDGTRRESSARIPLGDPRNFMSAETVLAKFHGLVDRTLGEKAAHVLEQRIQSLESCENVATLRQGVYATE